MRIPLLAGNWKMNGTASSITTLVTALCVAKSRLVHCETVVFPSYPYLPLVAKLLSHSGIGCGAQNANAHRQGAFTGEVSLAMLQDCGCGYVIVGHSERRSLYSESNEVVADKFHAALSVGIKPILCVGETLAERQAGLTLEIIKEQLAVVLALQDNASNLTQAAIAYEPVWAIGTGQHATGDEAQEVHKAIRTQLAEFDAELASKMCIVYGGSVKPDNAAGLFAMPDIDGALVGGASLDAEQFIAIGESWDN